VARKSLPLGEVYRLLEIRTAELADKVVGCGNTSGREVDKFKALNVAWWIQGWLPGTTSSSLEVIKAWIDPSRKQPRTIHHRGKGAFMVAGKTIKLPSRMK